MPDASEIVTNTSPLLAIIAATGGLDILHGLYARVVVPREVQDEILTVGITAFGVAAFQQADWLDIQERLAITSPILASSLDRGEAAVIQLAQELGIQTVCIDETVGRRIARLSGLAVTGSLGVLVRAKREGLLDSVTFAIDRMRIRGIWISDELRELALEQSNEK
jgi:predicted nucleic acid-binding protein